MGDTTYAYDAQGRMVSKRVDRKGFRPQHWRYEWDGEDQLRRVHAPDESIWEYSYDPFGRRIGKKCLRGSAKTLPKQVTYLWSGNLLSEERRIYADGTPEHVAYHYEQGSFRPMAQEVNGEIQYIITDHLGTPKELLSEEGEVIWSARHDLWGRISHRDWTGIRTANDNRRPGCLLRFQGQIEDEESGLYYNRFRYYDPESGNYASSDPIGVQGGLRIVGYVETPSLLVDEIGLNGGTGNSRIGTGATAGGMDRTTAEWRTRYGPGAMRDHHLIPQAMLNDSGFTNRLQKLGYSDPQAFIDKQIARIPHGQHADLHNAGYNRDWKDWLQRNPNFTRADLENQTKEMMKKYNIPKSSRNMTRAYGRNC